MTDAGKAVHGRKTLVEEGTQFKGSLTSNCPVEVKGRVEGDLSAPALAVSASGAVHGKVKVGEMHSQGEIAGEFDADVVQLSGTVKDNTVIRAKSLEVKLTPTDGKMQVIFGECKIEVGANATDSAALPRHSDHSQIAPSVSSSSSGSSASSASASSASSTPAKVASIRPPTDTNGA